MWGLDNHLTALIDGITPSQSTFWKGLVAGTVNLSIGLMLDPISLDIEILIIALFVGSFSYGISIVLYIRASQEMGATRAQVIFSSAPIFGLALSALLLGEFITLYHIASGLLFVVAIILLMKDDHAHSHRHHAVKHRHSHRHDDGHHNHSHKGFPLSFKHSHEHEHEPLEHSHAHWPDLHHRHNHKKSKK